ncbi:DUF3082 domain-containing protein [Synechococcus elongatus]|uniref:DUF3082 domain-containing protein n=1 Tax=Synechococcus elongatus PCC 11801 TaxID=2219813 RepID=A0AAN1QM08_SYNEL|nr:DUF3082 domain-containing protein [Synechococcus elongatus]AZB71804.1 DUF3082 domain-containing protein [Synechococcus elongatus PCC 11801]
MSDEQQTKQTQPTETTAGNPPPTLPSCWSGSAVSGAIAVGGYFLTLSIASSFAAKPLPTGNAFAQNIAVAVRTLVVGMGALATGIFGIVALGLFLLGIQVGLQSLRKAQS